MPIGRCRVGSSTPQTASNLVTAVWPSQLVNLLGALLRALHARPKLALRAPPPASCVHAEVDRTP
eukprot:8112254-Pyramimonas_sp.AAC.1